MKHAKSDIDQCIEVFLSRHDVNSRYASFDFCYNYFQTNKGQLSADMEKSCFVLWGYLASWGMLRGSSELLQRSPHALEVLIKYFDNISTNVIWNIDVPDYAQHYEDIISVYKQIDTILCELLSRNKGVSIILVTKIMLGVFGVVPAFDTYFTQTFNLEFKNDKEYHSSFSRVDKNSITCIYQFYLSNKEYFDNKEVHVISFDGVVTKRKYKIAKLIDMYGFTKAIKYNMIWDNLVKDELSTLSVDPTMTFVEGLEVPTDVPFVQLMSSFCKSKNLRLDVIDGSIIDTQRKALDTLHNLSPSSVIVIYNLDKIPISHEQQAILTLLRDCWKNAEHSQYDPSLPDLRGHNVFICMNEGTCSTIWNRYNGYAFLGNFIRFSKIGLY